MSKKRIDSWLTNLLKVNEFVSHDLTVIRKQDRQFYQLSTREWFRLHSGSIFESAMSVMMKDEDDQIRNLSCYLMLSMNEQTDNDLPSHSHIVMIYQR